MNAIDCRGLHKTYEGFVLHDLSFSLPSWAWWGRTARANPPPCAC